MLVHNVQQSLDGRVAAVTARGVRGFRRGGRSWTRGEGHGIGVGHMDILRALILSDFRVFSAQKFLVKRLAVLS